MKKLIAFALVIIVIALAAIATKPSDEECLRKAGKKELGDNIVNNIIAQTGASKLVFDVQDHLLYKSVYDRTTSKTVAYGLFGTVIASN